MDRPRRRVPPGSEPEVEAILEPGPLGGIAARGAGLAGGGYVISQMLTLAAYLVLARLVTPSDFGQFAAAAVVVNAGLLFTESGMLAALIHRRDRIEEAANTAVVATAVAGLGFAVLALAVAPLVGLLFDSQRVGTLSAAMSGLLLLRSLQVVPEALLQRQFSFLRRVVIEPLQAVSFGVAAIIATSNGLGPWGLVVGLYVAATVDVLLSWSLVRWRPHPRRASFAMWRELISYGRPLVVSGVILRVGEQLPIVVLGRYVGTGAVGQFRYADRIVTTPVALVVSAAAYVIFPVLARISHDLPRLRVAIRESLRSAAMLSMPLGMALIPLGVPLAVVVFGDVWRDAGQATMALGVYTASASLTVIVSEAMKSAGRPDVLIPMHTVHTLATGFAIVALLPFELVGVAAGISLGTVIATGYAFRRLREVVGMPVRSMLGQIWAPALAAGLMAAAMYPVCRLLLDPTEYGTATGLALLAGEGVACLILYAGILLVLAPDTAARVRAIVAQARDGSGP